MRVAVKDWPIAFSDALVKALLAGQKTRSRRLPTALWHSLLRHFDAGTHCRLWVREAFAVPESGEGPAAALYRATAGPAAAPRWRPPRHMPRRLSRLTLEVTGVRCERLQAIGAAEARAEGVADRADFQALWGRLHARAGTRWADDPEVFVLGFEVREGNIDGPAG